ncbi:MAG: hypothetical protein M1840_009159 [Geoglossum simile]|nr:MAG: hypothetical protein M1840_009159 [Geoglossum simile]
MSNRVWAIETAFELNDIPNERWQDDVSLHSSTGNTRYTRKPSVPRHRRGTTDMIFDPVVPGNFLTNAIDMNQSNEVMYREFEKDWKIISRNLPRFDEAYAVQSRDYIAQQDVTLTLAARNINHHIAGNAFAAEAHNRRNAGIAQALHDMNRQQSRERVFRSAVGSATAPPSITTVSDSAQASFTLGSPFAPSGEMINDNAQAFFTSDPLHAPQQTTAADDATQTPPTLGSPTGHVNELLLVYPRVHSGNNPAPTGQVQLLRSLSDSSSLPSEITLGNPASDRSVSQRHQNSPDAPRVAIHSASPVPPTASGFTRPHIHLRELTRLSLLADLDSISKGDGSGTIGHSREDLRPASPKPMSMHQRQEIVRARVALTPAHMDGNFVEGNTAKGGNGQKQDREGSWWSKLKQCFRGRKGNM